MSTEQLKAASARIAAAGGPVAPWDGPKAWCDLHGECVYGDLLAEYDADKRHTEDRTITCPPAIPAAIVWYAGEVRAWLLWQLRTYSDVSPNEDGSWEMICDHPSKSDAGRLYQARETQHEAAEALIIAVGEALGDKHG